MNLKSLLPAASDQRAARQTFWIGAITAAQFTASIAQVAISARILGPQGLGILAIIIAIASLTHRLISLPGNEVITTFVTRGIVQDRTREAAAILRFTFALSQALSLISYALLAAIALAAAAILGDAQAYAPALLLYGTGGIAIATMRESMAVLRIADRLQLGFVVALLSSAARIGFLLAAWTTQGGLTMVVLAYVAGDAVNGIGLFIAAAASERRAGLPGFLRSLRPRIPSREIIAFQVSSFWRASIEAVILHIDIILIANIVSLTQIGLYRAAHQIIDATKHPFRTISVGVQAEYSRQWYTGDAPALRRIARRFTLLALALALCGYGLLALIHQPVIAIMLGDGFEGAANPLLFLIPGAFAFALIAPTYILPAAAGRALPHLAAAALALATMTIAILALAPAHGAAGAAWANTIGWLAFAATFIPFISAALRRKYTPAP